ncbi:MAG TPA: hypothetical protein VMW72_22360 [Sedimentisphaerales bacterium]|nr:hypothetical protein [Sedimentisphaerales bacterium]
MLVDNLTKLSRSSRNAVSASLILIAALAMYNWIVAPRTNYLLAAQRYDFAMDNVVKKNKTIDNRVKVKKKKLQELLEQSAQLQGTLFTFDQAREFFSDLQAISEQTGCIVYSVNLISNNPNPIKDGQLQDTAGIVTKSAVLSVVGVYKNITRLIERLQSRTQKVWIDSVKVQALNNNSDRPRCDITITICALTDKEPAL